MHGDRGIFVFPVQLTTSRIGNLTRLIHTLLYQVCDDHTYTHIYNSILLLPCLMVYLSLFILYFFSCPCMAINVSVQYKRWASPRHNTVNPMLFPSGNPFKCHEEILYLQPMMPSKLFDIFSPLTGGCSEGLGAF